MEYIAIIRRVITYIEDHLYERLTLSGIANYAYLSVPHLYRIFPVTTGCTIGQYIRYRRLSTSVNELLNTDKTIMDIALDFRFESQESYIRAFKSHFGITPGSYRKVRSTISIYEKLDFEKLESRLQTLKGEIIIQPDIISRKFLLVGVENAIDLRTDFNFTLMDMRKNIIRNAVHIRNKVKPVRMLGFWQPHFDDDNPENEAKRKYFAGIEVISFEYIPDGFISKTLPDSMFAVFKEDRRGVMTPYAYTKWLPSSGYKLNDQLAGDFEIFKDMEHFNENDEADIYLPIQI